MRAASYVTPPTAVEVRAILIGDDAIYVVRRDGTIEPLVAPGHPRPGCSHAVATRRAP